MPIPPIAKQLPETLLQHGHERIDPYYWLNQRENPEVLAYLEAENDYANAALAHTKSLQEDLFNEIKGKIKEDDEDVPYFNNGYWYYSRFEKGADFPIYCRKKASLAGPEEILLNGNEMGKGKAFFSLTGLRVSPDNETLVYFTDEVGRRQYEMHFKNLLTNEVLPWHLTNTNGSAAWANDNKTIFYGTTDPVTLRSDRVWRYVLGEDPATAEQVYFEAQDAFSTYVYKAKSDRFIYIGSSSTSSSEQRYLDANQPNESFKIIQTRQPGIEYSAEDYKDDFYIVTNFNAPNFQLMKAQIGASALEQWKTVVEGRNDVRLNDVVFFRNFYVLEERAKGLNQLRIRDWDGKTDHYLPFPDPTYDVYTEKNFDYESSKLRLRYTSLTTPNSILSYDMMSREMETLKVQEIVGGYQASEYTSERLMVKARDGVEVPVSLVYKKGLKKPQGNPTLLYAYGSYGSSMDAYFSVSRLSLLDRGFVFAIAHVRGGEELGRQWYEDGKLLKKMNTFNDFIDCGKHLIHAGYAEKEKLFAMGGSAGGLLIGAVVNMEPSMWKGAIAAVPFVDVVTTMLDESIPLTTGEFEEWGDPKVEEYYHYMLSYSPYDQVKKQAYPNLLVTTGLHDSQVQYWEPAKWVAKLRTVNSSENLILLVTDMEAGHGGKSGRYNSLKDIALEYAFIIDLAGR